MSNFPITGTATDPKYPGVNFKLSGSATYEITGDKIQISEMSVTATPESGDAPTTTSRLVSAMNATITNDSFTCTGNMDDPKEGTNRYKATFEGTTSGDTLKSLTGVVDPSDLKANAADASMVQFFW